jgi:hypothetical protein
VGRVPGHKPWLEASVNQIGKAGGIPGLGSLFSSSSSLNNPGQYMAFLRATANGSVHDLGTATVNGVQTTHYHASIDPAKLPGAVPPAQRQAMQHLAQILKSQGGSAAIPIDVWIDSQHLVRRIVLNYALQVPGIGRATDALREDFTQYGPQPAPAIPPASQTENLFAAAGQRR